MRFFPILFAHFLSISVFASPVVNSDSPDIFDKNLVSTYTDRTQTIPVDRENAYKKEIQLTSNQTSTSRFFHNDRKIMINCNLFQFNYKEKIPLSDVVNSYQEQFGRLPDTIGGKPKSTEYGTTMGISIAFVGRLGSKGLFIMPQSEIDLGLNHTYSGSSQALPIVDYHGDTIGVNFIPVDFSKSNYFFNSSLCLGYKSQSSPIPFALYSGLRINVWKRDMNSGALFSSYERYTWLTIPVGLVFYKTFRSSWLSFEGVLDFMFYGQMKIMTQFYQSLYFPAVILGNKYGYSFELSAGKKLSNYLSFQISPFFTAYGFGISNVETVKSKSSYYDSENPVKFYEPESSTRKIGMKVFFNIHIIDRIKR